MYVLCICVGVRKRVFRCSVKPQASKQLQHTHLAAGWRSRRRGAEEGRAGTFELGRVLLPLLFACTSLYFEVGRVLLPLFACASLYPPAVFKPLPLLPYALFTPSPVATLLLFALPLLVMPPLLPTLPLRATPLLPSLAPTDLSSWVPTQAALPLLLCLK